MVIMLFFFITAVMSSFLALNANRMTLFVVFWSLSISVLLLKHQEEIQY